ncbi:MAG: L-lysine 6-transaminase [Acidobacteria bacterium]|nr:L-lysine 6-transaminase [Acidobacteriota bacterium]
MSTTRLAPDGVLDALRRRMQVDGLDLVLDLERSHGCRLVDARDGRELLDFFTFFASNPIGMNHPALTEPAALERLARVAVNKPSNSDVYTEAYGEFVEAVDRVARHPSMRWFFFVDGGALAVENALKVAFDWKVRRNFRRGHTAERGHQVLHLEWAFHGRSGYTLSLTNTADPRKTMYFPKFDWPRIPSPAIHFPLDEREAERLDVAEADALARARQAFEERRDDVAAIIVEPIQAEGGDRHFRPEFLAGLRALADEFDALLIFDEVQTGVGMTGTFWAFEQLGAVPDLVTFAKKMQIGGMMAGPRVDEEPDNVFHVSRINSTWGGHLVDMFRATRILEVIERERLVENAGRQGARLLAGLETLGDRYPGLVGNVRGRGLMCAISFPDGATRDRVIRDCHEARLLVLPCGQRSLRFRPALNIDAAAIDEGLAILDAVLRRTDPPKGKTASTAP